MICHPGGPGFSSRYFEDLAGLHEERSLILLDPRGTGGSDRPADARAYAMDDYITDLEELRRHLGIEQFDLLGHSFGGFVAIAYAALHPGRVRRLVLVSTLARFSDEQAEAVRTISARHSSEPWYQDALAALAEEERSSEMSDAELGAIVARELPLYFARYDGRATAFVQMISQEGPNFDALALFNREIMPVFNLVPRLSAIPSPTLVITGLEDFITGPVCAREIAAGIPDARLVILPDTGHFIFHESPAEFRRHVARFLNET